MDTPLLMLAGDLDIAATSLAGAMRMYNALVRAGKQPVLARYWGEGHVAASPAAMRDQWQRVSTWFDHYLKH
jgi:dipeptidyl aminopeptidase/acylaminoacyl peptidase